MEKILLTGVAGFIGAKTAEFLLEQGHTVVGIDNLNDYYDVRLKQHRLKQLEKFKDFHFHQIDIEDLSALGKLFTQYKFQAVLNLAARAGVRYSIDNPHIYVTTNAHGSLNLLELARKHKVEKYVLASTSSLYAGLEMPFNEELAVNTPISPYAATKKSAEAMAYTYHYLYGIDVTILRYFTVYGPSSRPDMAQFRFLQSIDQKRPLEVFGTGTQSRDFTYVDDIARGTILGLKKLGHEIINLGGGKNPVSINQMIQLLEQNLGKKAEIKYAPSNKADMDVTWADIAKAKRLLGWGPQVTLEQGLKLCVEDYQRNHSVLSQIKI